jgi:hypothetical protein
MLVLRETREEARHMKDRSLETEKTEGETDGQHVLPECFETRN